MTSIYRSIAAAILITGAGLLGTNASAAPAGPFSPLTPVVDSSKAELQQVDFRHHWGRRCYRECHVGRYGRLWCTWHCYRPRRWW